MRSQGITKGQIRSAKVTCCRLCLDILLSCIFGRISGRIPAIKKTDYPASRISGASLATTPQIDGVPVSRALNVIYTVMCTRGPDQELFLESRSGFILCSIQKDLNIKKLVPGGLTAKSSAQFLSPGLYRKVPYRIIKKFKSKTCLVP